MQTDEERMRRSRDTVDQIHESVQRMVEDNKRCGKEREAEHEADLDYRKKHGGKSRDDVMMRWVVGAPVTLFLLTFLVFMYTMLPLLIKVVIRATAEWSALLH
ncbi:hypothetical protein BurMR1_0934 [Burkholderia sp. MR1]|nr:hypothetical protein BurMR1_0934 [Burkholderia sp. MR1]